MRDINSTSRGEGCLMAPNRRNSLPCTVRSSRQRLFNQRIGCLLLYVVEWLRSKGWGLWISARCVVCSLIVVRMAVELKYRNTPYIHIISNLSPWNHTTTTKVFKWQAYDYGWGGICDDGFGIEDADVICRNGLIWSYFYLFLELANRRWTWLLFGPNYR